MFDTMTLTKIVGALCGSLLVFLLGSWAAEIVFHMGGEGAHSEETASYVVETGEEEAAAPAEGAETGPSFDELFAAADVAAGEKAFKPCAACHKLDGANGTGPHLNGVVGRPVGKVEGFGYSEDMAAHGGNWTPADIDAFIKKPKAYLAGTKMGYPGMKDAADRANLIAYLASTAG